MKKRNKIALISLATTTIAAGAAACVGSYFYNLALNKKISESKDELKREALDIEGTEDFPIETIIGEVEWFKRKSNYIDINIKSFDNLDLHGYKIINENKTDNWVIIVHGYCCKGIEMTLYAKKFYELGFNILIPDLRGHGLSNGNYIGMGWHDRLDILGWINYLVKAYPDSKIILHGVSMGAATVCMASGEDLPENVKAIISDCGYTSAWEQFTHHLKRVYSLPSFPILNLASVNAKFKAGYSLKEASAIKQLSKSKTPIIFIHGDKDNFVPYAMMEKLYNATSSPKEMVTIKDAEHAKGVIQDPETYWNSIMNFLNKYL